MAPSRRARWQFVAVLPVDENDFCQRCPQVQPVTRYAGGLKSWDLSCLPLFLCLSRTLCRGDVPGVFARQGPQTGSPAFGTETFLPCIASGRGPEQDHAFVTEKRRLYGSRFLPRCAAMRSRAWSTPAETVGRVHAGKRKAGCCIGAVFGRACGLSVPKSRLSIEVCAEWSSRTKLFRVTDLNQRKRDVSLRVV